MIPYPWQWSPKRPLPIGRNSGKAMVIGANCYRKYGHNEADDPALPNPFSKKIDAMPSISDILSEKLVAEGDLSDNECGEIHLRLRRQLDASLEKVKTIKNQAPFEDRSPFIKFPMTSVRWKRLCPRKIWTKLSKLFRPAPDFNLNHKIKRQVDAKAKNYKAGQGIDWGWPSCLPLVRSCWREPHSSFRSGQRARNFQSPSCSLV